MRKIDLNQTRKDLSKHDDENPQMCIPIMSIEKSRSIRNSTEPVAYIDDSTTPLVCPICYEEYEKNESISISRNDECHHVYHVECILQWLMDNDDCPMCRCKYIDLSGTSRSSTSENEEDIANGSSTIENPQAVDSSVPPLSLSVSIGSTNRSDFDIDAAREDSS